MSENVVFSMAKGMLGNVVKTLHIPPWELIVCGLIMLLGFFLMIFGFSFTGNIKYPEIPDDPTEGFAEIEDEVKNHIPPFSSLPVVAGIDAGAMARNYVAGKIKSTKL